MDIDLDAGKRARAEVRGDVTDTLTFGGETYELPAELPFDFAEAAQEGNWRKALTSLLNGSAESFLAHGPSLDDLRELTEQVAQGYTRAQAGESSASRVSSAKTTKRSRPRSVANTAKS